VLIVTCPNCESKLDAPVEQKGRMVKCAKCGHAFILRFAGHDEMQSIMVQVSRRRRSKETDSTVLFPADPKAPETPKDGH
jgi:hypothetical protein